MLKKVEFLSLLCVLGYLNILSVASSDLVSSLEDLNDESKFQENVDLDQDESENEYSEDLFEPEYSEEKASLQRSGIGGMCNGRKCAEGSRCIRSCKATCVRRKSHEEDCVSYEKDCSKDKACCSTKDNKPSDDKLSGYCDGGKCNVCYKLGAECKAGGAKDGNCCQTSPENNVQCMTQSSSDNYYCVTRNCTAYGESCTDSYPCCPRRDSIITYCQNGQCSGCFVGTDCKKGQAMCCGADKKSRVTCPDKKEGEDTAKCPKY